MPRTLSENKYFIFDRPESLTLKHDIKKIMEVFFCLCYGILERLLKPKKNYGIAKKYKVSICAIFKNEAKYLREWIEFHKIVGIEHFYMYNNNSEDDYSNILQPYVDSGLVTLIDFPYNHAQMKAYYDCIEKYGNETEWLGFIDIDEFVVPNTTDTVYDFLKDFSNRSAVIIYWKMFGTAGLMDREENIDDTNLVTEDFTVAWQKYTDIGKCFWNTKYPINVQSKRNEGIHHRTWGNVAGIDIPPVNEFGRICLWNAHKGKYGVNPSDFPIQINHYFTKSFGEYKQKASKGDVYFARNPHDLDYFFFHEMKCNSPDFHAYKYIIKLRMAMSGEKITKIDTGDKHENG